MDEDAVGKSVNVRTNSDHPIAIRRLSKRRGRIHNADPAFWIQPQQGPAHQQSASVNAGTLHARHTHSSWEHDRPGNSIPTTTRRAVVNHAVAK